MSEPTPIKVEYLESGTFIADNPDVDGIKPGQRCLVVTREHYKGLHEWYQLQEIELNNVRSILDDLRTDFRCFIEQAKAGAVDADAIKRALEAIEP